MKLSLSYSPCPNDTFIFDAAVHHKVDTEGIEFDLQLADVEELNKKALNGAVDITKLSYHAFMHVSQDYQLLRAGGALGENNGPLLISAKPVSVSELKNKTIAIPGKLTTANLLLSIAFPDAQNRKEYLFSDIEQAVISGEADCGLIIHENRFTYQTKKLIKLADLGEIWEKKTALPIPLGGIVIKRSFDNKIKTAINRIIRRSMRFAYENPDSAAEYIKENAQEMDPEVMRKHIELYVNDYSFDVGSKGMQAVKRLFEEAAKYQSLPALNTDFFIDHRI